MKAYSQSQILIMCLGIGMVLHDLQVMQFDSAASDEGSSTQDSASGHLKSSKLEWAHNQVLVEMCLTIADDLKACLDGKHAEEAVTSHPQEKKPPSKRKKRMHDRSGILKLHLSHPWSWSEALQCPNKKVY